MSLSAQNLRDVKQEICTRLAAVPNIGEVLPSRQTFASDTEYFNDADVQGSRKAMDKREIAFCQVYLANPRVLTGENDRRIFNLLYILRAFRKGFVSRVNEADAFETKILLAEDVFDATCVSIGQKFSEDITGVVVASDFKANIRPVTTEQFIRYGKPEYIGVEGFFLDFYLKVEVINVC
jgi:hypothetical protein